MSDDRENQAGSGSAPSLSEPGGRKQTRLNEDWMSLILGLFIFFLTTGVFTGTDLLGWAVKTNVWISPGKALSPVSKRLAPTKGEILSVGDGKLSIRNTDGKEQTVQVADAASYHAGEIYESRGISGPLSLALTFAALLVIMTAAVAALGGNAGKFALAFLLVFAISYLCWFLGHFAYVAATRNQLVDFKIPWALSLTGEIGFIFALIAGLAIGNFLPGLSGLLKEAGRPELYIKTAIVIMGAGLGVKAAESLGLATAIMFRGFCAIIEAYLIYWATVYWVARRYFKFSREWAAPLASGISICGVSAAIATGGAIRARPIVPIMVSSLVVIFVAVEMILLPFVAKTFLWAEPLVAGAWMGLAVKSDGGAIASGAITDALIRGKALESNINYAEGWITMTATTVKMFIDIFIGLWAFLLAIIWSAKIEARPGDKVRAREIWDRFPKFVIGYAATFFILLAVCLPAAKQLSPFQQELNELRSRISSFEKMAPAQVDPIKKAETMAGLQSARDRLKEVEDKIRGPIALFGKAKQSSAEGNSFRSLFFLLCFFTIGLSSNFKKLREEGVGKLAAVYVICLFGFIIWVGLLISWLFFHGAKPPILPM